MVPSKVEEQVIARLLSHREPIVITESAENVVDEQQQSAVTNGINNGNGDVPTSSTQIDTPDDNVKGR